MRHLYRWGCILLLIASSLACLRTIASPEIAIARLEQVETAEEERAAFALIWQQSDTLRFTPFDAEGETLRMTQERWWEQLHTITLTVDGVEVEHTLIDPENIGVLMRE